MKNKRPTKLNWLKIEREPGDDSEVHPHVQAMTAEKLHIAQVLDLSPGGTYHFEHTCFLLNNDHFPITHSRELIYKSTEFPNGLSAIEALRTYLKNISIN